MLKRSMIKRINNNYYAQNNEFQQVIGIIAYRNIEEISFN